jgi:uncharacterized radical SAM superfamily Fe-S cluster-containing enzyme
MANDRLRLASVEITRRCNNACPYCDQPKAGQDMPVAQFADLLDALSSQGVEAVALGGGEPTLHPALPALLAAAGRRGLRVGLTTNARAPDLVARLADQGLLDSFGGLYPPSARTLRDVRRGLRAHRARGSRDRCCFPTCEFRSARMSFPVGAQ